MTQRLKESLALLVAQIEEQRLSIDRQKAELLKGEPTWAAGKELIALNQQIDHLRLAEDILSDAMTALDRIEPDNDGEQAA